MMEMDPRSAIVALLAAAASASAQSTPATRTTMTTAPTTTAPANTALATTKPADTWTDAWQQPDPTAPLVAQFRADARGCTVAPTGLTRADYLRLIAGNVDFWKQHQDADGAIIDPYRKVEWQYSTPCFALAAVAVAVHGGRDDLLEPAALAMDWACARLAAGEAAQHHEEFYVPVLAHALPLFAGRVDASRHDRWRADLASIDPAKVYRQPLGGNNWNVVSLSGEYLLHRLGLREGIGYIERSLAAQGKHFGSTWGLYTEGPMAYDAFPRLWADDMMAAGYDGLYAPRLRETLRRGALTSLFMQSPAGELPTGGRSAQHQWNEAEQCVTYEVHAARAKADGDAELAGAFKRASRLALASMFRWRRDSGELFILKNRADPAAAHGFEAYSGHSQYNLLPMAMLAIAHEHAATTEDVPERPAPADVGGFVVDLRDDLGKLIANAGGTYVELETRADPTHNPTGLLRVHRAGLAAPIGPSDGITAQTIERYPTKPAVTAAVGPAWRLPDGAWRSLAEQDRKSMTGTELLDVAATRDRVTFRVVYHAPDFGGPSSVVERYELKSAGTVTLAAELPGYDGPTRMVWPVLAGDGAADARVAADAGRVTVTLGAESQSFAAPGAASVRVEGERHAFRNGWARLGVAEFAPGFRPTLVIGPPPTK